MKKFLLVLLFASVLATGIFAQTGARVFGTLQGKEDNVSGALVTIEADGREFSQTANEKGEFEFRNIPSGKYTISAQSVEQKNVGYWISQEISFDYAKGETKEINPKLTTFVSSSANRNFEVNVEIATGEDQPIEDVAKSVNLISGREMRERADFALVESLRSIPGFRIQQLGGFGKMASIKSRGLRNQDTALLLDGFRFRDASAITGDASAFLSDITLTSVSRIEVMRGAGSSLYGTNAVGGTINFITPAPRKAFHGSLSGAYGGLGLGRIRGNTSFGTESGKFGFNMGVARTIYSAGIDGNDDAHNTNFQIRFDWKPTATSYFSGRIFLSDAFVRLNSSPDTLGIIPDSTTILDAKQGLNFTTDVDDPDDEQRSASFAGQLEFSQVISESLVFKSSFQGLRTSRDNQSGPLGVGYQPFGGTSRTKFNGEIYTARASMDWNRENGSTNFGYEFEQEYYGNNGFSPTPGADFFANAAQRSHTASIGDFSDFQNGRLQIGSGLRFQKYSLETPEFSAVGAPFENVTPNAPPNAITLDGSLMYRITASGLRFRTHAGTGYRVPSLYERFGAFYSSYSQSFTAIGDPYLKPEKTFSGDAGFLVPLGKFFDAEAVYFYSKLIDTVAYANSVEDIGNTSRPWGGYLNEKGGIARGGEFSVRSRRMRFTDVFASYTFTNSDQKTPQVAGSGVIQTLGIPKHQFTAVVTQRYKGLAVNVDIFLQSNYLAPVYSNSYFQSQIYRFEGNRRADITARYDFAMGSFLKDSDLRFVVFGTLTNVFKQNYFENGFRTEGRTGRIGLSISF
ncbi:MAG: TonB-dependent receptor plug domain-containing protein [Pyrinomonadaceae bacterium]